MLKNPKKVKYSYNPETLRYEKINNTKKNRMVHSFILFAGTGLIILAGSTYLKKFNIRINLLKEEQSELKSKISKISESFISQDTIVTGLLVRENNIYRSAVDLQPISTEMLQPGFGGSEPANGMEKSDFFDSLDMMIKSIQVKTTILNKISKETDNGLAYRQKRMTQIPSLQPIAPTDLLRVGDRFSKRRFHYILKIWRPHEGVDLIAHKGKVVFAPSKGRVISARRSLSFGNVVEIDHGFNITTLYAHLSKIMVNLGDTVYMGDTIGLVGSTGLSTGDHLHYEVHNNGQPVDPMNYIHVFFDQDQFLEIVNK